MIEARTHRAYGVRWDTVNDLYAEVQVDRKQIVTLAFTRYIVQEGMLRCVIDNTGALQYLLSPTDSTKKLSGVDSDLSGADGQVMVRVPMFWYAIFTDGDYKYFLISKSPFSVYRPTAGTLVTAVVHPWFYEGGLSTPSPYKYISAFEGVLYRSGSNVDGTGSQTGTSGDLIRSVYGYIPLTYFHQTERRTYSVDGVFHQFPYWANEAMMLLWFTEYKSWNSQGLIPGYTEGGAWNFAKVCKTGITASLGNASGSILWQNAPSALRCSTDQTDKYVANSYRGIENFFGHVWKWTDGINIEYVGSPLTSARIYISNNPSQFADGTVTNYTDTGVDFPLASGYQQNLHDGTLLCNDVTGASSVTFIRDYFYASSGAGWRALRSGGALGDGARAGVAYRDATYAATYRYATVGGRLSA